MPPLQKIIINTDIIKLEKLTDHLKGAQIYAKVVSEANGGAHKIYNATVHCLIAKKAGKKYIIGDTGGGYAGKMLSMAAKKFGLRCKIFMGAKDIKRQRPNVEAMRKNGATKFIKPIIANQCQSLENASILIFLK